MSISNVRASFIQMCRYGDIMLTWLFVFLFFPALLPAQPTDWHWQDPYPTASTLRDIAFVGDETLVTVGYEGAILRSPDGGATWKDRSWYRGMSFESVFFLDDNTGWIAGSDVLKTNDGGETWTCISYNLNGGLIQIQFINDTIGFVCSAYEAYCSQDGGKTWSSIFKSDEQYIRDFVFLDDQTGWLITNRNIYKTTAGGTIWKLQEIELPGEPRQIVFVDAEHGFIRIAEPFLLRTNDGGEAWQILSLEFESTSHIDFLDPQIGWMEADSKNGELFFTNDGGESWAPRTMPIYTHKIYFRDSQRGYTTGLDGSVYRTDDGGYNWKALYTNLDLYYTSLFFLDGQQGWAAGSAIAKTTDGGATWELAANTGYVHSSITFTSPLEGWTVGAGTLYQTEDGGATWNAVEIPAEYKLTKVCGLNSKKICAVGEKGTIVLSEDNGQTWKSVGRGNDTDFIFDFNTVHFINETHGWVGGGMPYPGEIADLGVIGRTTDGGLTWSFQENVVRIVSIQFFDQSNGICCGYSGNFYGVVYKTSNGGKSWQSVATNRQREYRGLYFVTPKTGWLIGNAVGMEGTILFTTDGGVTVQPEFKQTRGMSSLFGLENGHAWATGGGILHRRFSPTLQVTEVSQKPYSFCLGNYPNPFNPGTAIHFELPTAGYVSLTIYNIQGRMVRRLLDGRHTAGNHTVIWDGAGDNGNAVAAGVYVYRLKVTHSSGETQEVFRKMSLVR